VQFGDGSVAFQRNVSYVELAAWFIFFLSIFWILKKETVYYSETSLNYYWRYISEDIFFNVRRINKGLRIVS
jgi:hypothetical protein